MTDDGQFMTEQRDTDTRRAIEAILLVADQPTEPQLLAQLLEVPVDSVERICEELRTSLEQEDRGFILAKVAGGYRYQTHTDLAPYIERFVLNGQVSRLSAAALETLAIVAYKQPISRNQVSAIRGVNCDGVLRTLETRGYVEEISRDPGPGRALLYGTSESFLERLGLDSLDDLPPLGQFVPGADVVETLESTLMVSPELDDEDAVVDAAAAEATALVQELAGERGVESSALEQE